MTQQGASFSKKSAISNSAISNIADEVERRLAEMAEAGAGPWVADPLSWREFFSHPDHMRFPKMSDKQIEFCSAGLPDDPKRTFDRDARLYDVLVGLCGKGCVSAESRIYLPETGETAAAHDLSEPCTVATPEEGKMQMRRADGFLPSGFGRMLRVRTSLGMDTVVFEGHRFLARRRWPSGTFLPEDWAEASMLRPGDRVGIAAKLEVAQPKDLSDDELVFLGYMIGDGHFPAHYPKDVTYALAGGGTRTKTYRSLGRLKFYNSHPQILDEFDSLMVRWGARVVRKPKSYNRSVEISVPTTSSKILVSVLDKYALYDKKADDKRLPKALFHMGEGKIALFLSRLFATDGWVCRRKRCPQAVTQGYEIGYASKSLGLCRDVQRLLLRLGVVSKIHGKTVKGTRYWTLGIRALWDVRRFAEQIKVFTKTALYEEILALSPPPTNRIGDVYFDKVVSIEEAGQAEYYDTEVASASVPAYVADGFVSHNSGKDMMAVMIACFIVYILLHMRDPFGTVYGASIPGEPIDIVIVAPRGRTSEKVTFEKLKQRVKHWKWLRSKFRVRESGREIRGDSRDKVEDDVVEIGQEAIVFPGNIRIFTLNSSNESAEGFNLLAWIATEFAAFVNSDDRPNAEKIFDTLKTSANSRFPGKWLGILISYPRYKGDAMMVKYKEAVTRPELRMFPMKCSSWDFNPMLRSQDYQTELTDPDPNKRAQARGKYLCDPSEKASRFVGLPDRIAACVSGRQPIAEVEEFEEEVRGMRMRRMRITKFNIPRQPDVRKYVARIDLGRSRDRAALVVGHVDGERVIMDLVVHWKPDPNTGVVVDIDDPARIVLDLKKRLINIVYCFTGDTKVALLDGRNVPIRDLVGEKEFGVYSFDGKNIVPGRGHSARKTRENAPIYAVELDNGEVIRCTGDHPFMLRDGSYRTASELRAGDSLMPLYRKISERGLPGYEMLYQPMPQDGNEGRWRYTHRVVSDATNGKCPRGSVIHHADFSKTNNNPDNLKLVTREQHRRIHDNSSTPRSTEWRAKLSESNREAWRTGRRKVRRVPTSEESQRKSRKIRSAMLAAHERGAYADAPQKANATKSQRAYVHWSRTDRADEIRARISATKRANPEKQRVARLKMWETRRKNHKVTSVKFVGHEDVYDLTVDEHHNFALSAGVFVHNCTYDQWNSWSSINLLNRKHIFTDQLSLGAREYQILLNGLYSRAYDLLNFHALVDPDDGELFHLTIDNVTGKVDHEEGHHNDLTEAACGVYAMLKGTKKNVDDISDSLSNVKPNLHDVSSEVWSDEPPDKDQQDDDDDLFPGEGFSMHLH